MDLFDDLGARAEGANADRQFDAQAAITLRLSPAYGWDMWILSRATSFGRSPERLGRYRRTIRAARDEVLFEFEDFDDARDFIALFC